MVFYQNECFLSYEGSYFKYIKKYQELKRNYFIKIRPMEAFQEKLNTINEVPGLVENMLITSKTQIGKTQAILDTIKIIKHHCICVIVSDNRKDQMEQMKQRSEEAGLNVVTLNSIKLSRINLFFKTIKNASGKIVILVLNNSKQSVKLDKIIKLTLKINKSIKSYYLFHDEGDTINKIDNVSEVIENSPVSHSSWIMHLNSVSKLKLINYKRIFVSATPENCYLLYDIKIKNTLVIQDPKNYRIISAYSEWDGANFDFLEKEVKRINENKTKEAILYCSESKNENQHILAKEIYNKFDCPIIIYNGINIKVLGKDKQFESISSCFADVETNYEGAVIVIGHRLMDRGVSFVSSKKGEYPLTATILFYTGSSSAYSTGINQRLGRITGTSRPDICRRKVYCPEKIMEAYRNYFINQNRILLKISKCKNPELFLSEIISDTVLENIGLLLDRRSLKEPNLIYSGLCSEKAKKYGALSDDPEKMKRLINNWNTLSNASSISKIFKKIYNSENHSLLKSKVKKIIIHDLELKEQYLLNLYNMKHSRRWSTVFCLKVINEVEWISITDAALIYLTSK